MFAMAWVVCCWKVGLVGERRDVQLIEGTCSETDLEGEVELEGGLEVNSGESAVMGGETLMIRGSIVDEGLIGVESGLVEVGIGGLIVIETGDVGK
jgi:hypothetical protein